jgi:predicted phosphodiesterase
MPESRQPIAGSSSSASSTRRTSSRSQGERLARVAALADVHGNAPALAAVLLELEGDSPDLVVFCGDLTWGSLPQETLALVRALEIPARFVRGNADRAVLELSEGGGEEPTARERWMASQHTPDDLVFLAGFESTVTVDVDGLGPTCFCHGSPRSDEECVSERTPAERVHEFMAGREERVVVTGHIHLQHDRTVSGFRSVGPGSVGLPYGDQPGYSYWAMLGPEVELRRTPYDLDAAIAQMRATDDPRVDDIVELMLKPPPREEVLEEVERLVFAG